MRAFTFLFVIGITMLSVSAQSIMFEKYFENQTLRIDYVRSGNTESEKIEIKAISKYDKWAGSRNNLIYPFDYGHLRIRIEDVKSGKMIFSKNFDSIFYEYRLTKMAQEGTVDSFEEVQLIPFPKNEIKVYFDSRDKKNVFKETYSFVINPSEVQTGKLTKTEIINISDNGNCFDKFDLTFLAEGYSENEKEKFINDVNRYLRILLNKAPFNKINNSINISALFSSSKESGVDVPYKQIEKETLFGATYNGLGDPRYLILENIFEIYNVAMNHPTDLFIVICNTNEFGANGIFNYFVTITNTERMPDMVITHELGHYIGGLADEYYQTANFAHGTIYPENVEPVEPNITTLTDKNNIKWKKYLSPGIEIPTEWGKEKYDSLTNKFYELATERRKKIAKIKDKEKIKEVKISYKKAFGKLRKEQEVFIKNHPLRNKVGVFEGAGHTSNGVYRPTLNSIMFVGENFNIISENTIEQIINLYTSGKVDE